MTKMISDEEVSRLEADQRREKTVPDRRRSEALSLIRRMREMERRLQLLRGYVEAWEAGQGGEAVVAILDQPAPSFAEPAVRPDRRKRRMIQVDQRRQFAESRLNELSALIRGWDEDDDTRDMLAIIAGDLVREEDFHENGDEDD